MVNPTCQKCGQTVQDKTCPTCDVVTPANAAIFEGDPPLLPRTAKPWPVDSKTEPDTGPGLLSGCIVVAVLLGIVAILVFPAISKVKSASKRAMTTSNMKQIVLACHNFADTHKRMPTPKMTQGRDHVAVELSWRVSILPWLDQEPLYARYMAQQALDWDAAQNVPLQNKMPEVYLNPFRAEEMPARTTTFQYFTGPGTLFPDNGQRQFEEIPDGARRTLLFSRATEGVIWTRPADISIRRNEPLPLPEGKLLAAFADASVRTFDRDKISDTVLRELIDPNDRRPEIWD